MRKYKLSITSLIFSIGSLIALSIINFEIADRYSSTDNKGRALFGIIEYFNFSYKYYLVIPCIASLVLAIWAVVKKESKSLSYAAIAIGILSVILLDIPIWRLMVK